LPKILGWIPARWHSKGLPGKNKRLLGGVPLIVHAIRGAQLAACLDRIMVSTDDPEIAQLARAAEAEVPWMRPAELAADDSPVIESAIYDLGRLRSERGYCPEAVMLLQPTSPFRTSETIRVAAEMFSHAGGESVVSVTPAREHPFWCRRIAEDGALEAFLPGVPQSLRRQALPPAYRLAGVVYVASPKTILSQRSFFSGRARPLVISSEKEALDIDTAFDWLVAEALWKQQHSGESE
jgi:CMP-N,N'-diacetyllegionaminic acid synthase